MSRTGLGHPVAYVRAVFDVLFLCWAALVVAGTLLSVRGTKQGNARKRELGRRMLMVAGATVVVGLGAMVYVLAVAGTT